MRIQVKSYSESRSVWERIVEQIEVKSPKFPCAFETDLQGIMINDIMGIERFMFKNGIKVQVKK
jgi:hypothetical protein